MQIDIEGRLADLGAKAAKEKKRFFAKQPKPARDVLASVMTKRGYAASKAAGELQTAWARAAERVLGEAALAGMTRAKGLARGRLEVTVANHVVMQEINFHRPALLTAIQQESPNARVSEIRFKVGRLS